MDGTHPVMFCSGLIVSWTYLRFYQRHSNGSRGDSADNFTFASFFPAVLQPIISILVNPIYKCSIKMGIIKPLISLPSSRSSLTSVSVSMPGVDPHDMERRRQIALKALSERLSRATDSSRQNTLPKSFPNVKAGSSKNHHHQHHHNPAALTASTSSLPSAVSGGVSSTSIGIETKNSAIVNIPTTSNSSSNLIDLESANSKP